MPAPKVYLKEAYSPDRVAKTSPAWCMAIWRLDYPISFDRSNFKSVEANDADGANLRGRNPLILVGDIATMSITASKAAHVQPVQATIRNNPDINYLSEILPGDWFGIWMLRYEDQLDKVIKALKKGDPANFYTSGFKGIGRVDSFFKDIVRLPDGVTSDFAFTGSCFAELDTQIYYEEGLAQAADKDIPTWMQKTGVDIEAIWDEDQQKNGQLDDNIHKLIPAFFNVMLGKGAAETINTEPGTTLQNSWGGATQTTSALKNDPKAAPYAYVVPSAVSNTLNRKTTEKVTSYADIMTLLIGRQEFNNTNGRLDSEKFYPDYDPFTTDITSRYTGKKLLGAFLPLQVGFVNTPMWSMCQQFLNPACNEMFTAFKADPYGNITPTVQVRQIPFTTSRFPGLDAPYGVTKFLDLPRWVIPAFIVSRYRVGRSNATRTNFVRVYGQAQLHAGVEVTNQLVENGTIHDRIDIQRSGLHPYATVIGCETVSQANNQPSLWMKLVADRMMGSHLTLSGQMVTDGIMEPICPGDNLEFDNVVYHIESVTHSCGMQGENKYFTTSFALSNGVSGQEDSDTGHDRKDFGSSSSGPAPAFQKSKDYVIYAGLSSQDSRQYEGGIKEGNRFDTELEKEDPNEIKDLDGSKVTGEFDGF